MSADIRARLDAERITISSAAEGDEDAVLYAAHTLAPALLAFARDVLDLADKWAEEDGPHPSHDHHCPDDLRDEIRTLATRHLGGGSDD